ncbi:MAG: response regulator transcription factor [Acidobacteria bacterium]|nr:response regulator transcription factor [Acidobacteriota bacterium]
MVVAMQVVEYRFLVLEHSVEIYGTIVAAVFAAAGIWLGLTLTKTKVVVKEVPAPHAEPAPFSSANHAKIAELGLTPRELEVLNLIAEGLSTKEMAERLFVSENTIKTHTSRVLDKLGASRRTQAVQIAKQFGLVG